MNYIKIYNDFIESRRTRTLDSDTYYEAHHPIPRSVWAVADGNTDTVELTHREHVFAHWLLYRISPSFSSASGMSATLHLKRNNVGRTVRESHKTAVSRAIGKMNRDPVIVAARKKQMSCELMRPWTNHRISSNSTVLSLWELLDQVYLRMQATGHKGKRLAKHFGYPMTKTWQNMVKYLIANGDPRLDPEFLKFKTEKETYA